MGTNLKDLLVMKEIGIEELKKKRMAVDSFNMLYQFLSTIRQRDGTLLKDSKGRVTSHLVGLFSRTARLMQNGLKMAFVFDGEPPKLKEQERERRTTLKEEAMRQYKEAEKRKDVGEMKKYAARTSKLTGEMIEESKELIDALGLPVIQAPSEGEAQVAYIVNNGDAYAGVSEDYDSLLYGIPRLVKNLTISGKRRFKATWVSVKPQMINLSDNLNNLGIEQEQLIVLAMLVGTDYNPGGVKGIGPKSALKLVKEYRKDYDALFKKTGWDKHFELDWNEIYKLFKNMPVEKRYNLEWKGINKERLLKLLVDEHEFSAERVENTVEQLMKLEGDKVQKGLGGWIR